MTNTQRTPFIIAALLAITLILSFTAHAAVLFSDNMTGFSPADKGWIGTACQYGNLNGVPVLNLTGQGLGSPCYLNLETFLGVNDSYNITFNMTIISNSPGARDRAQVCLGNDVPGENGEPCYQSGDGLPYSYDSALSVDFLSSQHIRDGTVTTTFPFNSTRNVRMEVFGNNDTRELIDNHGVAESIELQQDTRRTSTFGLSMISNAFSITISRVCISTGGTDCFAANATLPCQNATYFCNSFVCLPSNVSQCLSVAENTTGENESNECDVPPPTNLTSFNQACVFVPGVSVTPGTVANSVYGFIILMFLAALIILLLAHKYLSREAFETVLAVVIVILGLLLLGAFLTIL